MQYSPPNKKNAICVANAEYEGIKFVWQIQESII